MRVQTVPCLSQSSALLPIIVGVLAATPSFGQEQAQSVRSRSGQGGDVKALEEIVVIGKGYGVAVGAKSVAPLREVPNTVTVIDQERIQEQNLFTLEDLALKTTGLNATGGDSALAEFVSRGFTIDNFLVDGVPNNGFTGELPDLFLYDRVEVLRGPAGLFSGSGSPAGSINLVRKRPLPERSVAGRFSNGSWSNYRGEIDVSAPVSAAIGIRTGIAYQNRDQFYDVANEDRLLAFAVGDFDLTDTTRVTVGGHYDRFRGAGFSGLPGAAGGGVASFRRTTYAAADWNSTEFDTKAVFAELRQEVGDSWVVRVSGQYGKLDTLLDVSYAVSFTGVTPSDGSAFLLASVFTRDQEYLTADLNAVGTVSLFGRHHEVVVGADYQRKSNDEGFSGREFVGMFDLYNPDYAVPKPLLPIVDVSDLTIRQSGVYGQLRLKVADPLTFVFGGRLSQYENSVTPELPTPGPASVVEENGRFTPYAGMVWDFARDWSFYVSYADTFQPQQLRTAAGDLLPPVQGEQVEAGVKASLFNEQLLFSVAAFRIEQTDRAMPGLTPGTYVASGRATSSGIDIEANGEIMPGWQLTSGYSYIDFEDEAREGSDAVVAVPEHSVKLWTRYRPVAGRLQRFSFGGGVNWQSETEAFLTFLGGATGARQPSYAIASLRFGYEISDNLSLALNIENLFDKKYYSRISGTEFGNFYGAPLSALLTLSAQF